jgi:hypothetical protein
MGKTEGNYIYFLYITGIHQEFICPINSADLKFMLVFKAEELKKNKTSKIINQQRQLINHA